MTAAGARMASVTLENVRKVYAGGVEAVKGVSLAIPDGSFTVLLGPVGLRQVHAAAHDRRPRDHHRRHRLASAASVVNEVEPADRDIAMVFQNYALYPHMSVYDNMAYGLRNRGVPKPEIEARVAEAAKLLGIDAFLKRKPRELSGGQRQRVAMGRAIVREPQAFLFDEPLSNLDAKLRVQMRIEIRRLHNRLKATSIFVTHDQVEAMTLADTVVVMNQGRIEQIGAPTEVYRRPATQLRRHLHRLAGHEPDAGPRRRRRAWSRPPAAASPSMPVRSTWPTASRSRSASARRTCASLGGDGRLSFARAFRRGAGRHPPLPRHVGLGAAGGRRRGAAAERRPERKLGRRRGRRASVRSRHREKPAP